MEHNLAVFLRVVLVELVLGLLPPPLSCFHVLAYLLPILVIAWRARLPAHTHMSMILICVGIAIALTVLELLPGHFVDTRGLVDITRRGEGRDVCRFDRGASMMLQVNEWNDVGLLPVAEMCDVTCRECGTWSALFGSRKDGGLGFAATVETRSQL